MWALYCYVEFSFSLHISLCECVCMCASVNSCMSVCVCVCTFQVSVMQQELQDLQPELIKTSANTEQLMVKIEQDTFEVEAKREVLFALRTQFYAADTCFRN